MTTSATHADVRDAHPVERDAVETLIACWRAAGTPFVLVDGRGRHAARLAAGRLDLTHASALDARWLQATVQRHGYVLLDARNVPRVARSRVLRRALAVVQRLRTRTGQPVYVLVEDVSVPGRP
jgi:hypothetical protein